MKKFYIIFLFAIFCSIVLNPLFIKNGSPAGLRFISLALADDSTDSTSDSKDSSDSKDCKNDEIWKNGHCEQKTDDSKDSSDTSDTTDGTTDKTTTDDTTTDKTITDQTSDQKVNDNKVSSDINKDSAVEKDNEVTDSKADGKEYTLLDKITNDQSLLQNVINDETTDPGLVSNLAKLKQKQAMNSLNSEACDNGAGGTIATASNAQCAQTNSAITDTNAITDTAIRVTNAITNTNTNSTIPVDATTNSTIPVDANSTTTNSTTPSLGTCDNGKDNNVTSTINSGVINVSCSPPVSDPCGTGVDNNVTGTNNDTIACSPPVSTCTNGIDNNTNGTKICPILEPTVVIDSAVGQAGNALSPGDFISPQKVTFTFSAHASNTTESLAEKGPQGYVFECALDDESYSSCNSPMTYDMTAGKHNFEVRLVS